MAAPTYSTDLASVTANTQQGTVYRNDSTTALTTTGCLGTLTWGEPTGSLQGATPGVETDYFILANATAAKAFNATGVGGLGFGTTNAASIPTDGAIFVWAMFTAPNAVTVKSNGGIQVLVGNTLANYKRYYVGGEDTNLLGGWGCYPVSYTLATNGSTIVAQGTPGGNPQYFGAAYNVDNPIQRGNPAAVGGVRIGRGYIQATGGDVGNGYATFTGMGTFNDYNDGTNGWNRLGILQLNNGVYQYQGLLKLGVTGTAVDFRDSNQTLVVQKTDYVTTNFNTIEVANSSSIINWSGITINSLSTVSPGRFLMTDNANVTITNCTFTDMGLFDLQSNATITGSVFRRCDIVTQGNANISTCTFDAPKGTTGLLVAQPGDLSRVANSSFTSDGTGHAIEIRGTAANCTLSGVKFSGYAGANGTSGNETIFANIASGNMTINITNNGDTPTIRTAGANISIVNSKTFTVLNIIDGTELRLLKQSDLSELAGAENVGATPTELFNLSVSLDTDNSDVPNGIYRYKAVYSYGYTTDTPIYVVAFNTEYQAIYLKSSLKSTDGTFTIFQVGDRQYDAGSV